LATASVRPVCIVNSDMVPFVNNTEWHVAVTLFLSPYPLDPPHIQQAGVQNSHL